MEEFAKRFGVGPCRTATEEKKMRYVGSDPKLKGRTAIVGLDKDGKTVAQFDDIETGYGFGYWEFRASDFK